MIRDLSREYRERGFWKPETLPDTFRRVCAEIGDRTAIVDGTRRLAFDEALALAERLASRFVALGVAAGDVVSWQLPGWWEAVIVHHAALLAGALPNPLNPILRGRELRTIIAEAGPRLLLVPQTYREFDHAAMALSLRDEIPSLFDVIIVRGSMPGCHGFAQLVAEPSTFRAVEVSASDPALLLYTSGTTSEPKGVLHSHETLLFEIRSLSEIHALTSDDCYLAGSPLAHIAGLVYGALMPFVLGTRTALLARWDPAKALSLIEREGVTFQTGAPAFLLQLAEHPAADTTDLSTFRLFSTGGASITTETVRAAGERLGCVVKRAYGSTEVPTLTATRFEDADEIRVGTDGRVIEPAEMRIVLADGSDAPTGAEGEIWARSPEVFLGYMNGAEAFEPDGWFRTGDIGAVDAAGNLRVTGRLKDIIIRGGENISAKEIEDLLLTHPAIAEVAVIGFADATLGERACAIVVTRAGASFSFEEMTAWLAGRELAKQKLPERLEFRESLPRTESGKILKSLLRDELGSVDQ